MSVSALINELITDGSDKADAKRNGNGDEAGKERERSEEQRGFNVYIFLPGIH